MLVRSVDSSLNLQLTWDIRANGTRICVSPKGISQTTIPKRKYQCFLIYHNLSETCELRRAYRSGCTFCYHRGYPKSWSQLYASGYYCLGQVHLLPIQHMHLKPRLQSSQPKCLISQSWSDLGWLNPCGSSASPQPKPYSYFQAPTGCFWYLSHPRQLHHSNSNLLDFIGHSVHLVSGSLSV